jgi:hypothetical protein
MTDIKDFILQLEDTTLSLEEQQAALLMIEQTLIENKQIQEKTLEESSNLIVDAVRTVEEKLDAKFTALKTDSKLKGPKGDQGIRGENGKPGRDGVNGKDGINGHDGADGIDGKDGRYVVNVEVDLDDTLLVTLSDGTQIKTTKEIKGPKGDQGPQGLRGSNGNGVVVGGSTGQVLTKVSNTDYDVTWSTNGAGTVTSVGGTGTVNGLSLSGTVTSTGNLTLGGTLDLSAPPAIGATTATTGAFTTLTSTGGAVNGTIGATTPAAGTFTTITGQTEVLKGTGQNLQLQSQTFTNATTWSPLNGITPTANTTTAPDSTNTGSSFLESTTTINQSLAELTSPITLGITYTYSVYAKASTATAIQITGRASPFGSNIWANFNLSNGTVGSVGSTATASIVNAGSGWYRCIVTGVSTASATGSFALTLIDNNPSAVRFPSYLGTGRTVFIWGAQLEIGSTANTYIPTTTTAIYGTPTLSFSGVAGLGLESNGSLYVSPAGTGALQAQATTSTTAGGNARGANAVDWQTLRSTASMVASSTGSVIVGGQNNTSSSYTSFVGAGANNFAQTSNSFVGGGNANVVNQNGGYASIVGGNGNTASGYSNFIGGGFTNAGTSGSAVTTQSGTMNATTAVTLSGSNASIKVGQYITGTSIAGETYVAAISGTALTLSKVASGSSTSTLSFFTPHGVVVGGGNNQATGAYSAILGGGDAGTAANRNVASGDWSVVGGGRGNTASGAIGTFIGGGFSNTASNVGSVVCGGGFFGSSTSSIGGNLSSGASSFIGAGYQNNSSGGFASAIVGGSGNSSGGNFAFVGAGSGNAANANLAAIMGGASGIARGIEGNHVFPACNVPISSTQGITQTALLLLARQTTDATPTALTSNTSAAGTTNQVILPNNSAYYFKIEVIAGKTGAGDTKAWELKGAIKRGANAGTTAIVGTVTNTVIATDAGAATWTLTATADTTNGGITVTATGQAATTIRWVARCTTSEMTF